MDPYKAPGLNGFHGILYKELWETTGDDVWHIVNKAGQTRELDHQLA